MIQGSSMLLVIGFVVVVGATKAVHSQDAQSKTPSGQSGWTLPPDAKEKKSPLTVDDNVLAQGKSIFKEKCQKCHGETGVGDGPDADPEYSEDMDLTNPKRADRNPDGVVFYKVWNGRRKPKMPVFKEELTEQQVWSVVAYVQTFRKK
jgi:mono/diheme cytochrome c family protein